MLVLVTLARPYSYDLFRSPEASVTSGYSPYTKPRHRPYDLAFFQLDKEYIL